MFVSWLLRQTAGLLSRGRKLTILTYHRVGQHYDDKNPRNIHWLIFKLQMKWLKKYFNVLPLPLALDLYAKDKLPPRAVCLTIDDGYRDSYDYIFKTLQEEKLKATFFISTQGLSSGGLWDEEIYHAIFNAPEHIQSINIAGDVYKIDSFENKIASRYQLTEFSKYLSLKERTEIVDEIKKQTSSEFRLNYFLNDEHIKEMHLAGMTIGAHTHSHPILLQENDDLAIEEIKKSKEILEKIIGEEVIYFAYPNGKCNQDYSEKHVDMVKKLGFKAALSTDWGCLSKPNDDFYNIKRFTPWDETELNFILRLTLNYRRY
ncbi:polysaccharide deacetylase family protein [Thalassotalea ganghwensis]